MKCKNCDGDGLDPCDDGHVPPAKCDPCGGTGTVYSQEEARTMAQQLVDNEATMRGMLKSLDMEPGDMNTPDLIQDTLRMAGLMMPDHLFFLFAGKPGPEGMQSHYGGSMDRDSALVSMGEFLKKHNLDPQGWGRHRL